jgi:hypothetical protein
VPSSDATLSARGSPARPAARRRIRRAATALGIGAAWIALAALAVVTLGGALIRLVARAFALAPRGIVWLFVVMQEGADWWSIAGSVGTALARTLTTSEVGLSLIALELVGVAALYGLQRLLRDEAHRTDSEVEQ